MPLPQLRVINHRSQYIPNPGKNKKWKELLKKIIKKLFIFGLIVGLFGVIFLIGAFAWYSRDLPDPNKLIERKVSESTKIFDRKGEAVLYDVYGDQKRTIVKLADIPDNVKHATIAAEDRYFYEHGGFNILAMIKGVIIDPLLGRRARGGSTLTQQFVKNAILTNERRISRKIKEFILSYRIEKVFTKDEILQMYLNEIPYGSVSYGVQSASQTYFGKNVQDLTLGESAVLAALPQAPTYYSPYGSHKDALMDRQKYVLKQMVENKYITQAESDAAAKEEIKFAVKRESIIAPHFVMYVKEFLSEKFGDDLVERGGLKVTTTLDLEKQTIAEEAVVNGVEKYGQQYDFYNASLVSIDPKTGEILAMVGSKDYFDIEHDGNVNVSLRNRQPGSSIKPFIYLMAFKKGYTPNTVVYDVETTFKTDTKDYVPHDYDMKERGPVSLRKSLAGSLNIPAVKALYLVGVPPVLDFLELAGYSTLGDRSRFGLSLVLGGAEVKLLEHTAAYAALADEGNYFSPKAILKVEDSKGNVLFEEKGESRRIIDQKSVDTLIDVMSDNSARAYVFGESNFLTLPDRPVAAKTGTTNDYIDAWTMGFTPNLATGVWVGNNDNTEMKKGADGSKVAAPIWNEYMKRALEKMPKEYFNKVDIDITGKPILDGEAATEQLIKVDKFTGKLATELTPAAFIEERKYKEIHSILHYVDKNDPRGPVPADPSVDPAYKYWEEGIQKWIEKNKDNPDFAFLKDATTGLPPTEADDVHLEANKPVLFINYPPNNSTVSNSTFSVSVGVSAPRGVSRVEIYVDNLLVATKNSYPYDFNAPVSSLFSQGEHKLRAIAYDDVDNNNTAELDLKFSVNVPPPNFNWSNSGQSSVSIDSFPITLSGRLTDLVAIKKVDFYARYRSSGQVNFIGSEIMPQSDYVSISWPKIFERGEYEIYAEITDYNDQKHISPQIVLNVN